MKGSKEFYEELQQKKSVQLQQLEDGNASCLDVLIELESDKKYLKKHIEDIDLFKEKYQSQIESEASSYQGEYQGHKIEVRSGRQMFNYKGIKVISEKEKELKDLQEKAKQAFLAKQKGMLPVSLDGEEIELPEVSYTKSSVIVKKIDK
jgi:hypothetical protein